MDKLISFYKKVTKPLVLVSTLPKKYRKAICNFLIGLNAPVYLEAVSGLREEQTLQHLRIAQVDRYKGADGIIRIGGVPTPNIWRMLESMEGEIEVLSLSHLPFSGLSWGDLIITEYEQLPVKEYVYSKASIEADQLISKGLLELYEHYPRAEASLIHSLSKCIPSKSVVYLGNSLPIREWDLAAQNDNKGLEVYASRGLNGIDGQLSTFFGLSTPTQQNWGIFGDLTTLYDMAAPWILKQMEAKVNIVVVNNGGGMIFSRMFPMETILNRHSLSFEPLAKFWSISYERWEQISSVSQDSRLIELIPDRVQTQRFWDDHGKMANNHAACYAAG